MADDIKQAHQDELDQLSTLREYADATRDLSAQDRFRLRRRTLHEGLKRVDDQVLQEYFSGLHEILLEFDERTCFDFTCDHLSSPQIDRLLTRYPGTFIYFWMHRITSIELAGLKSPPARLVTPEAIQPIYERVIEKLPAGESSRLRAMQFGRTMKAEDCCWFYRTILNAAMGLSADDVKVLHHYLANVQCCP